MYELETRVVRHTATGHKMIINAADFDPAVHEEWTAAAGCGAFAPGGELLDLTVAPAIVLLPGIPGHAHAIGLDGQPTCGCVFLDAPAPAAPSETRTVAEHLKDIAGMNNRFDEQWIADHPEPRPSVKAKGKK